MKRATPGTEVKGKKFWGPPIWTTIHILAAILISENSDWYEAFLESLTRLLPCIQICRPNLIYKLQTVPPAPYLTNNEDAFFYTYYLHDMVNENVSQVAMEAGKDKVRESPPYEDAKLFYFNSISSKGEEFWGPPIWTSIHILAATLRPEDADAFKIFLESLTHLLPDDKSRESLTLAMRQIPPDPYLTNNEDAFFYTYYIHDAMNESVSGNVITGKKKMRESPPYDDVKIFYFDALSQECEGCKLHT